MDAIRESLAQQLAAMTGERDELKSIIAEGAKIMEPLVREVEKVDAERERLASQLTAVTGERDLLNAKLEEYRARNARLVVALESFVAAETEWRIQKSGMPPKTFDDPLSDAYDKARAALAEAQS